MNNRKTFALWQDHTVKGYVTLTEEQRQAINRLPDVGMYIGYDKTTKPELYQSEKSKKLYKIKMIDGQEYREYLSGTNDEERKAELLKQYGVYFCLMINTVNDI